MGLSLIVLLLVVSRAEAFTVCQQCDENAKRNAEYHCLAQGHAKGTYGYNQCFYNKYVVLYNTNCTQGQPPKCPDTTQVGQKGCETEGCRFLQYEGANPCGDADEGAGTICKSDCWGFFCSTNSTKYCKDIPAKAPKLKPSICYTKCGCAE
jgi:hypothetical protein